MIFWSQILGQLRTIGLISPRGAGDMTDLNQNSNNFAVVKFCFVAGFYPNVCRVDRKVGNLKSKQEKKLLPHVTSVLRERNLKSSKSILNNLPSEWIVFEEKSRVERLCLVRNITAVTPLTIALFGGPMYIPKNNVISMYDDSDDSQDDDTMATVKFVVDDWIHFVLDEDIAVMIHKLRIKLNALFMKTLTNLDKRSTAQDQQVVDLISYVLETEDKAAGFKCPKDVGARPILLPLKGSWRNKNKVQKSDFAERVPSGRSTIQNYQQPPFQQLYFEQRQQALIGPPRNDNLTSLQSTKSMVYRKIENKNASSTENVFIGFLNEFKYQWKFKPKTRYFVLHADSAAVVLESCKTSCKRWSYSTNMLRKFKNIRKVSLKSMHFVESVTNFTQFSFSFIVYSQRMMSTLFCFS